MKTTLIILTLNEIEGLRALFHRIPQDAVEEVLAVDGGSTDGSLEFLRARAVKTMVQERRGRGEAFRLAAREANHEGLIFFSPDGNEDPADIFNFRALLHEGYDMVIGSRFLPGGRNEEDGVLFATRKWANQGLTWIANLLWNRGPYISDTINGYRAITKRAFSMIKPDACGYAIEYQMSIRAMKLQLKVKEIPTVESNRIGGESKLSAIPTGLKFLRLVGRELMRGKNF